jgi:hypothetical protein
MQKLSGTSSVKNNKSCGIFHHQSNKIGFAFLDVSTIFYAIYKNQQKHFYYFRFAFAAGTLESFGILQICPWITKNTLETFGSPQLSPWGLTAGGLAGFRRGGGWGWWGEVGKCSGPHLRPIGGLVGGERVPGRGAPLLPSAAAVGAAAPARGAAMTVHWALSSSRVKAGKGRRARRIGERLGAEFGCSSPRTAAARPWWRGGAGSVLWRGGPARRGGVAPPPLIVDPCAGLRPAD